MIIIRFIYQTRGSVRSIFFLWCLNKHSLRYNKFKIELTNPVKVRRNVDNISENEVVYYNY